MLVIIMHPVLRPFPSLLQPFVHSDTKLWPSVGRIDDVHGDKNLVCSCPPVDTYVSPNVVNVASSSSSSSSSSAAA